MLLFSLSVLAFSKLQEKVAIQGDVQGGPWRRPPGPHKGQGESTASISYAVCKLSGVGGSLRVCLLASPSHCHAFRGC